MTNWSNEDEKLVTLARSARGRIQALSSAALRDSTGRTYASAEVNVETLKFSAIALVVSQAVASGAEGIEAIVICAPEDFPITPTDLEYIRGFAGQGIPIHHISLVGDLLETLTT